MVVVSAGIVMNLVLAVVFFLAAFMVGVKFNAPIIGDVFPDTPASRSGMQPGDTVVAINGTPVRTFADIQIDVAMGDPGSMIEFDVRSPDSSETRKLEMVPEKDPLSGLLSVGLAPASSATLSTDASRASFVNSALEAAGLGESGIGPGWRIVRIGSTPVKTWNEWANIVDDADGKPLEVTWVGPSDETRTVSMHANPTFEILRYPSPMPPTVPNYEQGLIGLTPLVRINSVLPSSPNTEALAPGDIILRAGNLDGPRDADFRKLLQENKGSVIDMLVLRDGKHVPVQVSINRSGMIGVMITPAFDTPMIAQPFRRLGNPDPNVTPIKTPVADLGLLPLTRIIAVGETKVINWSTFRAGLRVATRGAEGPRTIAIEIENPTPGHERQQVKVDLTAKEIASLQALGWVPPLALPYFEPIWTTLSANGDPLTAISMGFSETRKMVILTYLTIYRLVQGSVSVDQLRGPVGIVHLGTRIADRGFMYLVFFLAMISVNLAVLNFLPLPIVDGGLFLYLLYEKFKGRPPSVGFQNAAALIGLLIIGTIFVVTFYNDVMRLMG
jgi:regulator of sigma E protease